MKGKKIISEEKKDKQKVGICDIVNICLEHIELLEKYKSNIACVNLSKKHINYYLKNFKNSSNYRREIMRKENIDEIKNILISIKD